MRRGVLIITFLMSISLTGIGFFIDTDALAPNALVTCMEFILLAISVFGILIFLYEASVFVRYLLSRFFVLRKAGN